MLVRIATRRSQLALAQAHWVRGRLEALGATVELREFVTRGDRVQDVPLAQVGGKGLFTKEIEEALLSGEADLAVHSLKDLPSELPPGLILGAVPEREDARDVVVLPASGSAAGEGLGAVPSGARVGSSSARRGAQLRHARPDLRLEDVRGNVDTRLRKLDEGQYDALILAAAGLRRLGLGHRITSALDAALCTPAPGQGALGLQCREEDKAVQGLLARLNEPAAFRCVTAERALMDALGGGCSVPLGAYAQIQGEEILLSAVVAAPDGSALVRQSASGPDPVKLGRRVARMLRESGAGELLRRT
jgi:hydroxymethylbilane synthase